MCSAKRQQAGRPGAADYRRAAEVSPERAAELLAGERRPVAVAIVMSRKGCARNEAERLLAEAGGRVSAGVSRMKDSASEPRP